MTTQTDQARTAPKMPTSGSARRRAKAVRNRQAVAELTCQVEGHEPGANWDYCLRCGATGVASS